MQVEILIQDHKTSTNIVQILYDHHLIGGFFQNPTNGHYVINILNWYNIPRCLYPFIKTPAFFKAESLIMKEIEKDMDLLKQYNLYKEVKIRE